MPALPLRNINFADGTAELPDGRRVQIVMAPSGALGTQILSEKEQVDRSIAGLDQATPNTTPLDVRSLGLDQV